MEGPWFPCFCKCWEQSSIAVPQRDVWSQHYNACLFMFHSVVNKFNASPCTEPCSSTVPPAIPLLESLQLSLWTEVVHLSPFCCMLLWITSVSRSIQSSVLEVILLSLGSIAEHHGCCGSHRKGNPISCGAHKSKIKLSTGLISLETLFCGSLCPHRVFPLYLCPNLLSLKGHV